MNASRRAALLAALFFIAISDGWAQGITLSEGITVSRPLPQDSKEGSGSVTGRVTVGEKPAAGIIVIAEPDGSNSARMMEQVMGQARLAKATTDGDGYYRLTGMLAGRYKVVPYAPDLVSEEESESSEPGKVVSLAEGEAVEGIDFALSIGGVITGRVTDAEGRPLIGEFITLKRVDKTPSPQSSQTFSQILSQVIFTDDRGVYRIYGLASGSYIVGAGGDGTSAINPLLKRRTNPLTYFPGVTDEPRAKTIEVAEGAEVTGIDIKFGRPNRSYKASGRVVDAETGKPFPDMVVLFTPSFDSPETSSAGQSSTVGLSSSNSKGEFLFASMQPGRYKATVNFMSESEYYSEPAVFEIIDGDVTGIEIKLHRGTSISGIAVVEDSTGPDAPARFSQLILIAFVREADTDMPMSGLGRGKIEADGSFRITGLKPGKAHIIVNDPLDSSPLHLLRIERDGIEQKEGIEVQAGEHVSGVRLILSKGRGIVRGKVLIQGGQLGKGEQLQVIARRAGGINFPGPSSLADVDVNGRFLIEDLLPGDYELELRLNPESQALNPRTGFPQVKQNVTVVNEMPVEVPLVLDLSAKDK